MVESVEYKTKKKYDKILIIADVHGLIEELKEFLHLMKERHGDTIAYCIQLGDFWKGRNVIQGEKTFSFWKDQSIFDEFPYPIYGIKGNEDINIPGDWWKNGMLSLIPDKKEFLLDDLRIISVYYFEETKKFYREMGIKKFERVPPPPDFERYKYFPLFDFIPTDDRVPDEILTNDSEIDFIISHVPPYGLLDKTRDSTTHKEIRYTGNKFLRLLIDKRRPKVVFFGHNHFANYRMFGDMLVVSCDKFVRKIPAWADDDFLDKYPKKKKYKSKRKNRWSRRNYPKKTKEKNLFSYCLIIKHGTNYIIEMYRRDKLTFRYDVRDEKILLSKL